MNNSDLKIKKLKEQGVLNLKAEKVKGAALLRRPVNRLKTGSYTYY